MKQNSKIHIYDLAKRFRYGLLTKKDIEILAEKKDKEDIFFERLSEEMDDVWMELENTEFRKDYTTDESIAPIKKTVKIKHLILGTASIAAIAIIAFITFSLNSKSELPIQQSIAQFAQETKTNDVDDITENQLILSETETILLGNDGRESQVVYEDETIKIKDKSVTTESVADYNQIITARGKRSQLTLSDGTRLWVNSATRVVYPTQFNEHEREIYVDGEIYIEVAKESKRKFIVKTKDFSVQVLGTKFNVSSYEKNSTSKVLLVEGKVSVSKDKNLTSPIIMRPNELLEMEEQRENVQIVDPTKYISWTQGLYHLERETLGKVVTYLSQYYGVNIQCDSEIASMRCSGKIDLKEDVNRVLDILFTSYELSYVKQGEGYYIFRK